MLTLALDTSADISSLALLRDDAVLAESAVGGRMEHAAQLFPRLDHLLRDTQTRVADIDLYAVGIGPGSFNGIRVGIAAVKGLRLAAGKSMVGVSSAFALAQDAVQRRPSACRQIAVITDARRDEFYLSLYKVAGDAVEPAGAAATIAPDAIPALIHEPTLFVGPDNPALRDRFAALPWIRPGKDDLTMADGAEVFAGVAAFESRAAQPQAAVIGKLGRCKFRAQGQGDSEVEPIYLRPAVLPPVPAGSMSRPR